MVKNLPANTGDTGLIPGSGRSPAEGNGNPLQYPCLRNPTDRGAWWDAVYGVTRVGHDWESKQQTAAVCVCVCVSTPESKSCVLDLGQDSFCINKSELSVDAFVDYTSFASVVLSIVPFVQHVYWTPSKFTVILQLLCGKQSCITMWFFFFPSNSQLVRKKLWGEPPERPWKKNHKISTRAIMNWWACCYRGLPGASRLWQGSIIIFRIRRRKLRLEDLWCALGSESLPAVLDACLGASGSEPECLDSSHPELNPAKHLKPYTVLSVFLCLKGACALVGECCFLFCCNIFYLQSFSWTSFLFCQWSLQRGLGNKGIKPHLSSVLTFSSLSSS